MEYFHSSFYLIFQAEEASKQCVLEKCVIA